MIAEYNVITVYLKDSKEHTQAGLADDRALIRVWTYAPRPDVAKRRQKEEAAKGRGK